MNFKKLIALVLAAVMMMTVVAAFAATGDLDKDDSISVVGLDVGDTVNLYQIVKWVDGEGWKIMPNFADLVDKTNANYVAKVEKIVDPTNTDEIVLSKADVEKITNVAKKSGVNPEYSEATTGTTYTKNVALGMYLALVKPVKADTLYNPMIVSADYTVGGSNSIESSETMGTSTVAKKDTVTVEKEVEDLTLDVGDPYKFTITTQIPAFSDSYVNPWFKLSDTMADGVAIFVDGTHSFTITADGMSWTWGEDGTASAPAKDDTSFVINFDSAKIAALETPLDVTVEYYAYITDSSLLENIKEGTNDVTVEFPNNPNDDNGHGHQKDEVKVYTFTIDGNLFGNSDYRNSELIKVGLDKNGNPIESEINVDNGSTHAALDGAVFGLYTDSGCTSLYKNAIFQGTVETSDGGLMLIEGLDEGTYYLKEISAPAGYIKDPNPHTIVIDAETTTVTKEETLGDGCKVSYDVEVVTSYTVTVDGKDSTYTMTLNGPSISSVAPGDSSTEIVNTKGVELPSTGGIGTTLFYLFGGIMVLAAGVVLVARRKAEE